jgi:hypothetical protein
MKCKVRSFQLIPDINNPGKPKKVNQNMRHIIYDETMYFPIQYQEPIYARIKHAIKKSKTGKDLENRMNDLIEVWKLGFGLTTFKPLFPKENLGVLFGDPIFNFY